jgi:hydroxymethylbilane synthase
MVAAALTSLTGREVELVVVATHGDASSQPLQEIGGTGVFVSALREALADGRVDLVVHSLKDLPTAADERLTLAATPVRADARDVLVTRLGLPLDRLPQGARLGTGSPRRVAQLRERRPDLQYLDIRGNVNTRLRRLAEDELDALVLAAAGLDRLDRLDVVTEWLSPDVVVPAPGQGALAVEVRRDVATADAPLASALSALDDPVTRAAVTAERSLLSALEAGCSAPVGAYAIVDEPGMHTSQLALSAFAGSTDGRAPVRMSLTAPVVEAGLAGRQLAESILKAGVARP